MSGKSDALCFRCLVDELGDAAVAAVLREGIEALPEQHRTDEETYAERLSACRQCDHLVNGLCRFCGCFVEMRALKRLGTCPCPGGSRWKR